MQNNSNKNWENKGWEAMQQMLDQELPVEEKEPKRRLFFWYWAAGIAILLGVIFMNLQRSGFDLKTEDRIFPIAETLENEASNIFDEKEKFDDENDFQSTDNQLFTEKSINKNTSQKSTKSNVFYKKNDVKSEVNVSDTLERIRYVSTVQSRESERIFENKKTKEIASLPILFADLEMAESALPNIPKSIFLKAKKVERQKQKLKPIFSLAAGATANLGFRMNGFEAEGLVDFSKENSKFSFQTGLNYRFAREREIRQNWSGVPEERAFLTWGTQHSGNGGGLDSAVDPNIASSTDYYYADSKQIRTVDSRNYHFLSVPTVLQYQLHPKWNIAGGMETSFLLNSLSESSAETSLLADNAFPSQLEAFSNFSLKKIDFAATAVLKFQPSKQWNLRLKYHHGNLLQGNNWQVDNRFLSVGGGFAF